MPDQHHQVSGISRRTLCAGAAGVAAMLGLGCLKFVPESSLLRPPGGQDEDRLLSACIRCEKCYTICPNDVIRPAHVEDGLIGMRTPQLVFPTSGAGDVENIKYCDFCTQANNGVPLCVQACPTKALSLPADATAETYVIGIAKITQDECLAYRLKGCHFCYDACPYEAIEMDDDGMPHVIEDKCTGCGACEAACVSLQDASIASGATRRAIYVDPTVSSATNPASNQ